MARKKPKVVVKTDEEKYIFGRNLIDAVPCLVKDSDKAKMYESVAELFEELGDYEDAEKLCAEAEKKAEECRALAKKQEEEETGRTQCEIQENKKEGMGIFRKCILLLILVVIAAGIGGIVYLKTEPGRYARAGFYEKRGNYEKSYKMFHNLKDYKDSESRSREYKYEYALQCKRNNMYTQAKDALRELDDYKDSKDQLTELELENIKNSAVGTSVLFGEYKWLIVEKEKGKALLVKSKPINGYPYHENDENITWADSTLRKYLNNDFITETFYEKMSDEIMDTEVVIPDNEKYQTKGGTATTDKLFLLNARQAEQYRDMLSNYSRDWWLISPGNSQNTAQYVSYGEIMDYGYEVSNSNIYIRPAMWVKIK